MELKNIIVGQRVRITQLGSIKGFCVMHQYISPRQVGITGTVKTYVQGHGGYVWFIEHDDGKIGAYTPDEFELI